MRTSTSITQQELDAFAQFALENKIITDGEAGARNTAILCDPIISRNEEITAQSLAQSFERVKAQLRFKSTAHAKADELALKLSPAEVEAYRGWTARQPRLIGLDGSEEGFENCAALLGWMRGNPVTQHNLDLALGNIVNNPQFGRIHFKPQPAQDRTVVAGKINHALTQRDESKSDESQEFRAGRRNHAYKPKTDEPTAPPPVVDAWKEIVDRSLKQWSTHSQRATLEAEYARGVERGASWREIGAALSRIVKGWERGR